MITRKELRKKIEGVLSIAPNLDAIEIWNALLNRYGFMDVESIMKELEEERKERLRSLPPEIIVSGGKTLEEVIKDAEKKKN